MEAAHIAWRPLGRLLVEQGLLTDEELERALAQQQTTGRRLGETIVELGFVSSPDLASALAAQYGLVLTMETGFGTGLRAEIQRRHESDRGLPNPPVLKVVETPAEPDGRPEAEGDEQADAGEALLLTQLEEQWAKLAAAEASLAERERENEALRREGERRRLQTIRLVGRVRQRDRRVEEQQHELGRLGQETGVQHDRIERLVGDVRGCDAEIERLRHVNARLREQAARFAARLRRGRERADHREAPAPVPSGHLVFVQLDSGYQLVESDGPAPLLNAVLELPQLCEDEFVVTRLGRSPLPADRRACVFVQRF